MISLLEDVAADSLFPSSTMGPSTLWKRALDAGVDAYLSKPFDAVQFLQVVESTLKNANKKKKKTKQSKAS